MKKPKFKVGDWVEVDIPWSDLDGESGKIIKESEVVGGRRLYTVALEQRFIEEDLRRVK